MKLIIIHSELLSLLHASPTLAAASLARRFHLQGAQRIIHTITCECVVCRRMARKPSSQILHQLPPDELNQYPEFH